MRAILTQHSIIHSVTRFLMSARPTSLQLLPTLPPAPSLTSAPVPAAMLPSGTQGRAGVGRGVAQSLVDGCHNSYDQHHRRRGYLPATVLAPHPTLSHPSPNPLSTLSQPQGPSRRPRNSTEAHLRNRSGRNRRRPNPATNRQGGCRRGRRIGIRSKARGAVVVWVRGGLALLHTTRCYRHCHRPHQLSRSHCCRAPIQPPSPAARLPSQVPPRRRGRGVLWC